MKQKPTDRDYITEYFREKMAFEPESHSCFIVHKRKWYTPEEFKNAKGLHGETKDVQLKDPIQAIPRMRSRLNELENEFSEFTQKVALFFKDKKK